MKCHFGIMKLLKTVFVIVITAISSVTIASELEYVNVSRKELGIVYLYYQ